MCILLTTVVLINIFIQTTLGQTDRSCTNTFGFSGQCVPLQRCPRIANELAKSMPTEKRERIKDFLRKNYCGEPKNQIICCRHQDILRNSQLQQISIDPRFHPSIDLLDRNICGPNAADRISNGNKTLLNEFPWMALLGYYDGVSSTWDCGGSVINQRYVLTAAHCVTNLKNSKELDTVRLGEHDIATDNDCTVTSTGEYCALPVQDIPVERSIHHPQYGKPLHAHDIALVRMAWDADFRTFAVRPICLPVTLDLMTVKPNSYQIAGWGTTERGYTSSILLKASIPRFELSRCKNIYRSYKLAERQICAGGDNKTDTCKADSGGPLQYPLNFEDQGPKTILFGIISFGLSTCGRSDLPSVYTNVSSYMTWILDNLEP